MESTPYDIEKQTILIARGHPLSRNSLPSTTTNLRDVLVVGVLLVANLLCSLELLLCAWGDELLMGVVLMVEQMMSPMREMMMESQKSRV